MPSKFPLSARLPDGTRVHGTWTRQDKAEGCALILPGRGYTTIGPVMYYPRLWALEHGFDTVALEYRFTESRYDHVVDYVAACAAAAFHEVAGSYQRILLIGKSLGTQGMARLLDIEPALRQADCVWLTPIFADNQVMRAALEFRPRSLFVAGSADPVFDAERMQAAAAATGGHALLIDGADHSLDIPNDTRASLAALSRLVDALDQFIPMK